MAIRTELCVRLPNSPGALADLCQRLGEERVHILALSVDPAAGARLIVDNPLHAAGTLRDAHLDPVERDVLYTTISNAPGAFGRLLRLVAGAGVNVEYAYATSFDDQGGAAVVIGVEDAADASARTGI